MKMTVARDTLVALLILSCVVIRSVSALSNTIDDEAAKQIITGAHHDERELQTSMCRCQAYFEEFYADRRRRLQTSYPYDYSDAYQDDDGYFVVEDIKVINCRGNAPLRSVSNVKDTFDNLRVASRGVIKGKNGDRNLSNDVVSSSEGHRELGMGGKGGKGGKGYGYSGKGGKGYGYSSKGGKGYGSKGGKGYDYGDDYYVGKAGKGYDYGGKGGKGYDYGGKGYGYGGKGGGKGGKGGGKGYGYSSKGSSKGGKGGSKGKSEVGGYFGNHRFK
jgi:hypothetical protein